MFEFVFKVARTDMYVARPTDDLGIDSILVYLMLFSDSQNILHHTKEKKESQKPFPGRCLITAASKQRILKNAPLLESDFLNSLLVSRDLKKAFGETK